MKRTVTIVLEGGLHTRPAPKFAETADKFDADVQLGRADEDDLAPAASMLAVTDLGVGHDESVRLVVEGDDTKAALDALGDILSAPEVKQ